LDVLFDTLTIKHVKLSWYLRTEQEISTLTSLLAPLLLLTSSSAQPITPSEISQSPLAVVAPAFPDRAREAAAAKKLDEQTVVVVPGDVLTTIAERSNTTVERIFSANPQLENPDLIEVGEKIVIPEADEVLPDRTPEPPQTVIEPLGQPQAARPVTNTSPALAAPRAPPAPVYGGLTGSFGYALWGGNCVDEPGVNNPRNGTNPIDWPVLSYQPYIGATALWHYNHTGVVTGLWANGDVEVRHQNFKGNITRFPRSAFRGYR
jgi:LysM repeat protein